ncbi:phosphoribosylamine--glycine ligase [Ileibacterium valens]|uniref:Phosphoribosylamine--glycine ligase n=1 Tax=Ileibacterium valens TaxID=1862668 RepID=A0A1U7NJ58_9FIRM|nr:phosphoribosylamine--glycine ligase [Ileibacterium valens]OLU36426.1 phosphoribosylamine--glycine ligase [Erysipelotrichaceae bacterium NYU-BL-E8]OLU41428.1 phosphoribosylamine--glycine ligase [Erysipelotrichaceae bacterium NYU-BL-F16]OLU43089.1 phosphoribosylamine--glycine ligase [Ileibacterium valens]
MNILVVGKGGREHALALALSKSAKCSKLYCAPGNPGMAKIAECVNISDEDIEGLKNFAKDHDIDLTVVGPESSLAAGIANAFEEEGLKIFAPTKEAAQVESSKDFAKGLMKKYDIPTAGYETFDQFEAAVSYVKEHGAPIVIKENGLKAGKGVTVAMTEDEAIDALKIAFSIEGNKVVIEDYLEGFEFSLIALVNGSLVVPLECAQDHKRVADNDQGPNTGGMGSYSPVRAITEEMVNTTMETIMIPMAKALENEGVPFKGFLYGGLMVTKDGIKTIEFNARFGDPEAEVILARLESDFVDAIEDVMVNRKPKLKWTDQVAHGVVMASTNYPASSTKGALIEGLDDLDDDMLVYHMGTKETNKGLVTDGGRVLMIVSLEDTLPQAMKKTYDELSKVKSDELFYRTDIGRKDLEEWH